MWRLDSFLRESQRYNGINIGASSYRHLTRPLQILNTAQSP